MSIEPVVVELSNSTNFDGSTLITLTRDNLAVTGQRYYRGTVTTGGVIDGDFFGLFGAQSIKLVGISGLFHNPGNTLKVVTSYASGRIRQQVDITPDLVYVLVHPGDRLVIRTVDTGSSTVSLVVNELTEKNHVEYAHALAQPNQRQRLRIYHGGGDDFVANGGTWTPTFVWDPTKGVLLSEDVSDGSIPCQVLSLRDSKEPIYVRARFAGIKAGTGAVVLADGATQDFQVVQSGLDSVEWSHVFVLTHSDLIGFNGEESDTGGPISLDLDVVHVLPGDHLADGVASPLGQALVAAETPAEARTALDVNMAYVALRVDTLVGTGVSRIICPYSGTIETVETVTEGTLAAANATLMPRINGVSMTDGLVTIALAGSAAGDRDISHPTALNVVTAGDELSMLCGGGNATATVANALFHITRS